MKAGLTKRQREVLHAIRELTVDDLSPTYDELAERLGMKSRGHVSAQLVILRDKGRITFEQRARSIRIIDDGQPTELEIASMDRLRGVIEEATEAIAARIGHAAAADILALVLESRRAKARREAEGATRGRPHRSSKPG